MWRYAVSVASLMRSQMELKDARVGSDLRPMAPKGPPLPDARANVYCYPLVLNGGAALPTAAAVAFPADPAPALGAELEAAGEADGTGGDPVAGEFGPVHADNAAAPMPIAKSAKIFIISIFWISPDRGVCGKHQRR
ncbi:hypothetical protein [Acidisoma sp. S159]|uniref:hypothetical protein n=1 Tax=Acidisoma sp. S159 TaxID=1747225 RepID=UPI00131E98AB|nr:hypothetical protein [Acidisoma sp. S159]